MVGLIEEGIALSHQLARGLHPIDLDAGGLMQALEEYRGQYGELYKCRAASNANRPC